MITQELGELRQLFHGRHQHCKHRNWTTIEEYALSQLLLETLFTKEQAQSAKDKIEKIKKLREEITELKNELKPIHKQYMDLLAEKQKLQETNQKRNEIFDSDFVFPLGGQ